MKVLSRYKKKEMEGFKEYVMNFETSPKSKKSEKFFNAALEDPVYMNWVVKNVLTVNEILLFNSEEFQLLCDRLKATPQVFALSFYNLPQQEDLLSLVRGNFKVQIQEEFSIFAEKGFQTIKREPAQFILIQHARKLQNENTIIGYPWRLPELSVVKINKNIRSNGLFESFYEYGVPALKGQLKTSMRTGEWSHYYSNGKLMALGEYELDDKVGKWSFYYISGSIKAEGEYKEGQKWGEWKEYDKSGHIKLLYYPLKK